MHWAPLQLITFLTVSHLRSQNYWVSEEQHVVSHLTVSSIVWCPSQEEQFWGLLSNILLNETEWIKMWSLNICQMRCISLSESHYMNWNQSWQSSLFFSEITVVAATNQTLLCRVWKRQQQHCFCTVVICPLCWSRHPHDHSIIE
jgi:hypothetical protein